jgi:P pilus assembly chaperone PapD
MISAPKWPLLLFSLIAAALPITARAELVLSQVIVDLQAGQPAREDIEVFNSGTERLYVAADPFMIQNPGRDDQARLPATDPQASGILVSPQKLILEPGERRLIRIAAVAPRPSEDKVYRISIRPVAGEVIGDVDALKVFVGYDALVLYRPDAVLGRLQGTWNGTLPGKRLYPGTTWEQPLPYRTPVTYKVAVGDRVSILEIDPRKGS